jgi:two-component SAPR family response regulator
MSLGTLAYLHHKESAVSVAQTLTANGRPEDAVRILERLKQHGELTNDRVEALNAAYVQAGAKLGKKRQYNQAIDMLQKVQPQSKYKGEATELLRRFRRRG